MPANILIVEDEPAIRDMIMLALSDEPFILTGTDSTQGARDILYEDNPDLILLDWMLPGESGVSFIEWLKKQASYRDIPIILLTAKAEEANKVKGLMSGADDYITKPFSPDELIARIKTVLRRGIITTPEKKLFYKDLTLHIDTQDVTVNQHALQLTSHEYNMLHFFLTHPNKLYSRDQLITQVWTTNTYIDERTVDTQIRRLRLKLKPYGHDQLIQTVRGAGYQSIRNEVDDH